MNRPTNDVDNLLALANEAIAAADTTQAIDILRKAASMAPLRKDIRNRLAFALEQQPTSSTPSMVLDDENYFDDYIESDSYNFHQEPAANTGRDSITQIARKAFEAASTQTTKASVATRRLTDILHQGLENWKTVRVPKSNEIAAGRLPSPAEAGTLTQDSVFEPNADLQTYLDRAESSGDEDADVEDAAEVLPIIESSRITRLSPKSGKTARSGSLKNTKPKDMEDVIVAGIDSIFDAATRINKKKIAYGVAYLVMAGLFCYACFDVSRKFPAATTMSTNSGAAMASIGQFDLQIQSSEADTVMQDGLNLDTVAGPRSDIESLRQQLESARLIDDREAVRIKLTTLLSEKGDSELKSSQFQKSIVTYQEAVKLAPNDSSLKVRLANALYYQATSNLIGSNTRTDYLSTAASLLTPIAGSEKADVYALHLLALVQDARGNRKDAQSVWQKVKATAPEGSPIFREAESRLK